MPEARSEGRHPSDCNCPVCVPVHVYNALRNTIQNAVRGAQLGCINVALDGRRMASILRSIETRLDLIRREAATGSEAAEEVAELEQLKAELQNMAAGRS